MSDNANSNAAEDLEFTREELAEALPYRVRFAGFWDRRWYSPPSCPWCDAETGDLDPALSLFGKFPRTPFARCPCCFRVYFRPHSQEPALIKSPVLRSSGKYFKWLAILPGIVFIAGWGILGMTWALLTIFLVWLFLAAVAGMFILYIRDLGTTEEEIRRSRKRLESNIYVAALRDHGVEVPYYYLRRVEKEEEAAKSNHKSASAS